MLQKVADFLCLAQVIALSPGTPNHTDVSMPDDLP